MQKLGNIQIYTDGGSRGNPGSAASAFVIVVEDKEIYKESRFLGETTNNVAEYTAVVMALEWISKNQDNIKGNVIMRMDSELIVKQLLGKYRIKSPKLKPLASRAKELLRIIENKIIITHIPRSENETADFLVNEALDSSTG